MKYKSFLKLILLGIFCAFLAASCTKEGPMGPAGPKGDSGADGRDGIDGVNGEDGTDGTDGVDGNAICLVCHTKSGMDAIQMEYASSMHSNPGFELGYAGPRNGCMDCHSHQGFQNHLVGFYPDEYIDHASKITCGTCHGDHSSLEAPVPTPMSTMAAVTSKADKVTVFDFDSSSNLCAYCHQSRKNGSYYADVDSVFSDGELVMVIAEDSVYLPNSHSTPHYTTMTNNIFGTGGYTSEPGVVMNAHKNVGCVGCHMGEPEEGENNGGHTMVATLNSCTPCHSSATDFNIGNTQTEIHEKEEAVAAALVAAGILDESHSGVKGVYHKDVFEAYWNYKIVHYDRSGGVHNPNYMHAMLDYAMDKLGI